MPDTPTQPSFSTGPSDSSSMLSLDDDDLETPLVDLQFDRRYLERELLGEGGMGLVTLVEDRSVGRRVAMKSLRPKAAFNARYKRRFVREARVQGRLEHPAIVPVYELSLRPDGQVYFSMRAVGGDTLAEIVDGLYEANPDITAKFPRHRLLAAFTQVCMAIDYAHESGVVHCDIKPENIIFGEFGEVYVLDWGLAKVMRGARISAGEAAPTPMHQDATKLVGTPGYMSPEQVSNSALIGEWTDIYALGCILYEILTLAPLNDADTAQLRIDNTMDPARVVETDDVAPELDAIWRRATAYLPQARYRTARELHDAVDSYLGGERDAELRRTLSADLAQRAVDATVEDDGIEQRRVAMRLLGRSLALDPENGVAVRTFVELLARPPKEMPRDAHPAADKKRRRGFRRAARFSIGVHACFLLFVPLLWWASTLTWWMVAMTAFALAAMGASWAISAGKDSERMVIFMMLTSTACLAMTAGAFGLLVAPLLIAVNVCVYNTLLSRRRWTVGAGVGAVAAIALLEASGVFNSLSVEGSRLIIEWQSGPLQAGPLYAFMVFAATGGIIGGGMSCAFVRHALEVAERRLRLQTWHLRQALPHDDHGS